MLAEYFPVLLFMVVSAGIGIALIAIGNLFGPKKPSAEKDSPYECGFEAFEDARMKFDVRYYLIAILFIIFDLEIAFVLPWATVFSKRPATCEAAPRPLIGASRLRASSIPTAYAGRVATPATCP